MKRGTLYFSILLLFISVLFVSGSRAPRQRPVSVMLAEAEHAYNLTVSLKEQDTIALSIYPSDEWSKWLEPPTDYVEYVHKFVYVNITDPEGNDTKVEWTFVAERVGDPLYVYIIKVRQYDGIIAEPVQPPPFEGTVKHSGNYTINVSPGYMPPGGGPPYYMYVSRDRIMTDYPYSYLLPAGAATGILGLIMLAWSAKSTKPQRVRKKLQVNNHRTKPGFAT